MTMHQRRGRHARGYTLRSLAAQHGGTGQPRGQAPHVAYVPPF